MCIYNIYMELGIKKESVKQERIKRESQGLPAGTVNENSPASAGDRGLIPDPEDSACHGAIKSLYHGDWSLHTLEPVL